MTKPKDAKKRGRPSKYEPRLDGEALRLCRLGATDKQIAEFFEISEATLTNWKHAHPSFLASLKRGKDEVDALVEQSLFRKAMGYTFDSVKVFMPANAKAPVYAPIVEHCPPDTTACIFWLKNRQPDKWRDKREAGDDDDDAVQPVKVEVTVQSARKHADAQ